MNSIKYEGKIPATLRMYCDRHRHQIAAVSFGSGYCTESGNAYDVMLRDGWCDSFNPQCHTIIEPNVKDTLFKLRNLERCYCKDCHQPQPHQEGPEEGEPTGAWEYPGYVG